MVKLNPNTFQWQISTQKTAFVLVQLGRKERRIGGVKKGEQDRLVQSDGASCRSLCRVIIKTRGGDVVAFYVAVRQTGL